MSIRKQQQLSKDSQLLEEKYSLRHSEILNILNKKPRIKYDLSKPSGDKMRVMDISRAKSLMGWHPNFSLEEGIKNTIEWYKQNKDGLDKGYNIFKD